MKLKFKQQKFQADAADAVCDIFSGQPNIAFAYRSDKEMMAAYEQATIIANSGFEGYCNQRVLLSDEVIKANLHKIQRKNQIKLSPKIEGRYNLTVEMETGVGKTYTYIKTMFELHKRYGWSKFIIVVPSVAIREGVYKTFEMTKDHFAEEYGTKIHYFIYDSKGLSKIARFASDCGIHVMIINSHAFNSRGKDVRRIHIKQDSFCSRRPIDVIAATNPILIIDEPQSVEGPATKERLKEFRPLLILRYSATHKTDSLYNLVYRLDALEAYHKRLVKKIAVKGISVTGTTASESYIFLEKINLFGDRSPTAILEFEIKTRRGVKKASRVIGEGYNLYVHSGGLEEYRGYIVSKINGLRKTVEFSNGVMIAVGEVMGSVNEEHLRRIQIRETIQSHFERESQLFNKGIKVLSLFFIDEVANYKKYDENGRAIHGEYAEIFEEEYQAVLKKSQQVFYEQDYLTYLMRITAEETHAGYFSVDKKNNRIIESKTRDKNEFISDDEDAYHLIMKDKERLLDLNEPVRFIFSHSALREGWDNPNVFQICTLKQSSSDIRKRQEVGRGLRLCVNQKGERMDIHELGEDVHEVNVLTVIANESYDSFVQDLQAEIRETAADLPAYPPQVMVPEDARSRYPGLTHPTLHKQIIEMKTFETLKSNLEVKSAYLVDFPDDEFVGKLIRSLDKSLKVPQICFQIEHAEIDYLESKETLQSGEVLRKTAGGTGKIDLAINKKVRYDLIGKIVESTGLTRNAVSLILQGIKKETFDQFQTNPEEFIIEASALINRQKAKMMIEHR